MIRRSLAAASLLLATTLVSSVAPQSMAAERGSRGMPETLTLNHASLPIWIAASVAITASGAPNPAVWGEYTARISELLRKPAEEGCNEVGPAFEEYPNPLPRAKLEDAVVHSAIAVMGRVTDRAYGFYGGVPGQLLELEPENSVGKALIRARYYFFVPVARFRIGEVEICKTDPRYAEPPEVGSEVFLFVQEPADQTGSLFHILNPGDVVPVGPDGSLRLPAQCRQAMHKSSASPTKADLLAEIRALRPAGGER